jgi:hypothetical protein
MELAEMASHLFDADGVELALAASEPLVDMELRMGCGSLWTKRDAAWVPEGARVLTQMLRKPFAQLLGDAVFPIQMGRDLRVRRGEGEFALATYQGSTLAVHVEMAARQKGRSGIMVHEGRARRGKQDPGGNEIGRLPWSDGKGTKRRRPKEKGKDWARVQIEQVGGGV